jgi:uncharacterized cupredoxin-like copper-binding protein
MLGCYPVMNQHYSGFFWPLHKDIKMLRKKLAAMLLAASLGTLGSVGIAHADSTVTVRLSDKGTSAGMTSGLAMASSGAKMSMASFSVKAMPQHIKAGKVTFKVTNASKDTIHEMIVSPVKDPSKPLPYDAANGKVNEDQAGHLGEVSELDAGKSGELTLTLKPGTYILYCNIPGHFDGGMWTTVTVS